MYAHMFSRAGDFEEMKRIVEPPMHIDSAVNSNIQFADWVAACVSRAIDYQLIEKSEFEWIVGGKVDAVRGAFTYNSKVPLWKRSVVDIHHTDLFNRERSLYPRLQGQSLGTSIPEGLLRSLRAGAERNHGSDQRST